MLFLLLKSPGNSREISMSNTRNKMAIEKLYWNGDLFVVKV